MQMSEPDFKILGHHKFEEMNLPPILYKYRDWSKSHHKSVLTERELYLASPAEFEDEFDCKVPIRYDLLTDDDIFKHYVNSSITLHKHYSLAQHLEYAKKWQAKGLMRNERHLRYVDSLFFKEFNEIFGVLSLTALPDNVAMWDYYSNNQKGFCVGFNTIPLLESRIFGSGAEVKYDNELPIILETDDFEKKHFLQIFSKLKKWEFENEYRLTKFNVQDRTPIIPVEIFAEVILGPKISDNDKAEIKEIVSINFPKVELKQAVLKLDKIELEDII